jgi:hypothetical protein
VKISALEWLQNKSGFYLTGQVVAEDTRRERFKTVPYKGFCGTPASGISQSSTCIWAFLSSLKRLFSQYPILN